MSYRLSIADGIPTLVANGRANGHARAAAVRNPSQELLEHRIAASYDSARAGTDLDPHWAHADARDADSANNPDVRRQLRNRSRYETGSNGYYAGIMNNQVVLGVGLGPSLRMLTGSRAMNQAAEQAWFAWSQRIRLPQKLRCMAHARVQDGEAFAVLVNNPLLGGDVQLDVVLLETDQVSTPFLPMEPGYIDGIRFDKYDNVLWYDVIEHPGSDQVFSNFEATQVTASQMVHWFKLRRPSAHRGTPDLTSTLNVGASTRRMREATVSSVEHAASLAAVIKTQLSPANSDEPDPYAPFRAFQLPHSSGMTLPMGWDLEQMAAAHPNAQYGEFHRQQLSEMASPIGQPYNVAAHDSSTYSFASGKLDTLIHWAGIDIDRQDCDMLVLDKIFAAFFREWTILTDRRDTPPAHQWDWPVKPVIDAVAEAAAIDTKLKNGSIQLRQVYSDQGQDLEDQLAIMAEDRFGEATDETIDKCRKILSLINTPQHAIQYVAQLLGVTMPVPIQPATGMPSNAPAIA